MDEDRWPKLAQNFKPAGQREEDQGNTGKRILRPVQALICLIHEDEDQFKLLKVEALCLRVMS
jgi:hypothetical protein